MHKKYILDNGIRVITQKIPHVRSVSIGFWVKTGSISETTLNNGISHFIEHMLFKGTHTRTAKEIANAIDSIGGQLNAFTSKECTCYYSKVLDSHISIAIDIITDMILNSKFEENDIKREKSVIFEEINMYEDSPEDLAYDILAKTIFKNHSLGLPILGTHNTVKSFQRNDIRDYMKKNYNSQNIVISVAGSFKGDDLIKELNDKIGRYNLKSEKNKTAKKPDFNSNYFYKFKDIEQMHLCIGFKGVTNNEKDLYPLLVLNNIFGGSMSSRLFQTVREDNGLAYSIYSHPSFYKDIGLFTIYVSLSPSQLDKVTDLILKELKSLIKNSITKEELTKAKEQLKGSYILSLESTGSIMTMLGKSELFERKIKTYDEVLSNIDKVDLEALNNLTAKIFNRNVSMSVVGKADEKVIKHNYSKFVDLINF
ncbi:M16 family metallopeptidase [Caminicella sporogenes]|uniref:M16 family metallopeptidase n=1 Tax=Caminicella sporogenes TaxID=166485 RepID=UPI0025403DC7|nr:pitrilysin family protein [Caminicella sporogenes]WIF94688.1 pitrilysin family protein [Caminicella sporogenes]